MTWSIRIDRQFADDLRRIARNDGARRDIAANNAAGADHRSRANVNALQDQGIHADEHIISDLNGRCRRIEGADPPHLRVERVEIGIDDDGVGAQPNPIADADALITDQRAAGHAEVIADGQLGAGPPRAEDDRVVRSQRVAPWARSQICAAPDADAALAVALDDWQPVETPTRPDLNASQPPVSERQDQQAADLVARFPRHGLRLPQRLGREQRFRDVHRRLCLVCHSWREIGSIIQ